MSETPSSRRKILLLSCPGRNFVVPYIERELPEWEIYFPDTIGSQKPDAAVMLSGTEIYAVREGLNLDESCPVDGRLPLAAREVELCRMAEEKGIVPVVLRCAVTIGTGMEGYGMDMARDIARGSFFHFPGNDAVISVIHASQIARLVADICNGVVKPKRRFYNITDMTDTPVHDLAEALAFRMNNKRISTLSTRPQQWMGRIVFSSKYRLYSTSLTFSALAAKEELNFNPEGTVEYMRSHVYDNNSL